MSKEKSTKEKTAAEITFVCKFCGESKPLSEMTLQTRFFPVLAACRECEKALLNLGVQNPPEEPEEESKTSEDADTAGQ